MKRVWIFICLLASVLACSMPAIFIPVSENVIFNTECSSYQHVYNIVLSSNGVTGFIEEKCDPETGNLDLIMRKGQAGDFYFKLLPEYGKFISKAGNYEYECKMNTSSGITSGECYIEATLVTVTIVKSSLRSEPTVSSEAANEEWSLYTVEDHSGPGDTEATIYRIKGSFVSDITQELADPVLCPEWIITDSNIRVAYELYGSALIMPSSYSTMGVDLNSISEKTALILRGKAIDPVLGSERETLAVLCRDGEKIGLQVSFAP